MTTNRFAFAKKEELSVTERKKRLRAYMKERRSQNENRDVKELRLVENVFSALKTLFDANASGAVNCTTDCSADCSVGASGAVNCTTEKEKKTCFCYLSFSSEAPTDKLIENLVKCGFRVCAPRVEGAEMLAIELGGDYALSRYGILEPLGQAYLGTVDLIIMPLLAADERGNRLGYGGGYYDRFFKKHPQAKRVGYAFDFQIINEVPTETFDEKLDCIVTDKRIVFTDR